MKYWKRYIDWKENLTDEMYEFIEKELKTTREEITADNTYEFYEKLLDELLWIECDEAELIVDDNPISERGRMAVDISDLMTGMPEYTEEEIAEELALHLEYLKEHPEDIEE